MDPIDRYLRAVRSLLPRDQRDDIINELSANIRSQIDEREAELGRPLTEVEQEAILDQHGDPLLVAGRYRSDQRCLAFGRQLIGPVLFSIYEKVLLLTAGLTAAIVAIVALALSLSGNSMGVSETLRVLLVPVVIQFGVVTLIFIGVEAASSKLPGFCNPRQVNASARGPRDPQRIPRLTSLSEFIALGVFLGWLQALHRSPFLILGPAAEHVSLGPAWFQLTGPIIVLSVVRMAQAGINLWRPEWVRFQGLTRVVTGLGWLLLLVFSLETHGWVVPAVNIAPETGRPGHMVEVIDRCFFFGWIIFGAFAAVDTFTDLRQLIRIWRAPFSPLPNRLDTHAPPHTGRS